MSDLPPSVAIVSNSDDSLYRFHNPIMKKLVENGLKVYAVSPPGPFVADIERLGVDHVPWILSRRSLNPLTEFKSLVRLVRHLPSSATRARPALYSETQCVWRPGCQTHQDPSGVQWSTGLGIRLRRRRG